jgi:hypothetical protein
MDLLRLRHDLECLGDPFLCGRMTDVTVKPRFRTVGTLVRREIPCYIRGTAPMMRPTFCQPKAHSNPTAGQPHNQISSAPSNTEPFDSSSPAFTFWAARSSINSRCASNIRFIAGSERSLD